MPVKVKGCGIMKKQIIFIRNEDTNNFSHAPLHKANLNFKSMELKKERVSIHHP